MGRLNQLRRAELVSEIVVEWKMIEKQLCRLFASALCSQGPNAEAGMPVAAAAFDVLESFDDRLKVLRHVLKMRVSRELFATFDRSLKSQLSICRDEFRMVDDRNRELPPERVNETAGRSGWPYSPSLHELELSATRLTKLSSSVGDYVARVEQHLRTAIISENRSRRY